MKRIFKIEIPPAVLLEDIDKEEIIEQTWTDIVLPSYEKICSDVKNYFNEKEEIFNSWKNKTDADIELILQNSKQEGFLPLSIAIEGPEE
jgi:hypothetical protein